ncbi:glucokinase [Streptomyces sp. JNUCC 64]
MILAGDIGGTSSRLAVCHEDGTVVESAVLPSTSYPGLAALVRAFTTGTGHRLTAACFGLPGPVIDQRCRFVTLDWGELTAREVAEATGVERVLLLNDVEAAAHGIPSLPPGRTVTLNPGRPRPGGTVVLVSPGTGLGQAALLTVGGERVVIASEGGHTDFAPTDDAELDLLARVRAEHPAATYERVLSGAGLAVMYQVQRARSGIPEPAWLTDRFTTDDPARVVGESAVEGTDEVCVRALGMYTGVLAAQAANTALAFLALGGVYLGGGVVPKIRTGLLDPLFMRRFTGKDKMAALLGDIPVHLVLDELTGLRGAIDQAVRMVTR